MPTLTIRHVTTYRYRRPVAFGEHRMMLRPRDSHDRGEPRDQPGAQEPALRSGRIRQSCGDRAVFWSLKRAVLREHRVPRAFAHGHRRPRSRGPRKGLSRRLSRRRDAGPRPLHRTPSPRSGERGWPLGSSIPAPGRVERIRMVAQECPPVLGWRCSASDHRLLPVGASAPTF